MKKMIAVMLSVLILFPLGLFTAAAADFSGENILETFDDGSYMVVSDAQKKETEAATDIFSRLLDFFRKLLEILFGIKNDRKEVSGEKYLSYYGSDGTLLWTVTLKAEFMCLADTAECVDAQLFARTYDNDWRLASYVCSKKGNCASAQFTVKQTKLGVPLKSVSKELVLTCDANGILR